MRRIANKLQNVPLGDAQVVEQVSGHIRNLGREVADMCYREGGDDLIKGHKGLSTAQYGQQLFAY